MKRNYEDIIVLQRNNQDLRNFLIQKGVIPIDPTNTTGDLTYIFRLGGGKLRFANTSSAEFKANFKNEFVINCEYYEEEFMTFVNILAH